MIDKRKNPPNYNNYIYIPSLPAAIIACITYAIITAILAYQLRRNRVKYPLILVIGAGCESLGYFFRALGAAGRETNFTLFLLMEMFIVLSPLAFMAGLYVIYGRLVTRLKSTTGERFSLLKASWYTRVFVTCDISSFLVQAAGAGVITSTDRHTAETGKYILIAGLAIGFITFATFVALVLSMNVSVWRAQAKGEFEAVGLTRDWRMIMVPILIASACILIRTVYRLVEFSLGWTGPVNTTEWYLYIFDFIFMVICVSVWIPFFPSRYGLSQEKQCTDVAAGSVDVSVLNIVSKE